MTGIRKTERGFSLLEAIVAVAVLASAGLAIFQMVSSSIARMRHVEERLLVDQLVEEGVEHLDAQDPSSPLEGGFERSGFSVQWRAVPVLPPAPALQDHLQPGLFDVQLFRVVIVVSKDGEELEQVSVLKTGYRQVREMPRS